METSMSISILTSMTMESAHCKEWRERQPLQGVEMAIVGREDNSLEREEMIHCR